MTLGKLLNESINEVQVDVFRMKSTIEDIIKATLKEKPKATMAYVLNNLHYEVGRGKYDSLAEKGLKAMKLKERDDWFQRIATDMKIPKGQLMEDEKIVEEVNYAKEIADAIHLREPYVKQFMSDNNIDGYDFLGVIAKNKMSTKDISTALIGNPNNTYFKKLMKLI